MNLVLYLLAVLIWGSTWLGIKFQVASAVPAPVSVCWRFLLASAILFGWSLLTRRSMRFSRRDHVLILILGLFTFSVNYVCFYEAERSLASGLVALVFSLLPVFNMINGVVFLRRYPEPRVVLGAAVGIAGIVVVFWPDIVGFNPHSTGSLGLLLSVLGTISASFGNMAMARIQRSGLPVIQTNAIGMAYGAISIGIYSWLSGAHFSFDPSPSYVMSLGYLAIFGTVVAFGAYITLLGRIGPDRAAYAAVLFPIVALALSTLFEGYVWSSRSIVGAILILVGNVLVLARGRLPQATKPSSAEAC
jgi:drug/metabolite transporter (DMT)-like permease